MHIGAPYSYLNNSNATALTQTEKAMSQAQKEQSNQMWLLENQAGKLDSKENAEKSKKTESDILGLITKAVPVLEEIKRKYTETPIAICISVTLTLKLFIIDIS